MTLRLTLIPALMIGATVSAQWRAGIQIVPERSHWEAPEPRPAELDERGPGDLLFEENFANGLAGNNGVGAWTVTGPDGAVWQYDTDGPNGDFSSTSERIQSPSVTNGFMIFDSNLSNNGCVSTNSCVTRDGYLVSPVLDLSATPNAHLQWHQRLRWCCSGASGHFLDISTDGGATWPTRIAAIREQFVNYDPGTYVMRVNLRSAIAANPANVRFRFAHEGSATGNMSHYHWQIDDVRINESFENDVNLVNARHASFDPNNSDTDELDYSVYPFSQLRALGMGSPVLNEGVNTATNVSLAVTVTDPSNATVFTGSATAPQLGIEESTDLRVEWTPPAVQGEFRVGFDLTMAGGDDRPVDNTAERRFRVSPSIYAYDNGSRDGAFDRPANAAGEYPVYHAGNLFWCENASTAFGVQIALASGTAGQGTAVGAAFDGVLWRFDTNPPTLVAETDIVTVNAGSELTGNGQARWYNVDFLAPIQLVPGVEYAACVRTYGGNLRTRVATSGVARPVSSVQYQPDNDQWFVINFRPMVRLNFASFASVGELTGNGAMLGQNMPNPANGVTTITYRIEESAPVGMQLFDMTGKLVMDLPQGVRAPGEYRLDIDTTLLQEGVYLYTLQAGENRVAKRMTVVR